MFDYWFQLVRYIVSENIECSSKHIHLPGRKSLCSIKRNQDTEKCPWEDDENTLMFYSIR